MKRQHRLSAILAALAIAAGSAQASPLELQYSVTAGAGGLYDYDFTLKLDNHTGDWAPGQGWTWIIFGDVPYPNISPIQDFTLTSAVPAPFDQLQMTYGGHSGPTFLGGGGGSFGYFAPAAVGDSISWSGTSATYLGAGDLQFSSLITEGGASSFYFETADLVASSVPETSTSTLLVAGLGLMAFAARRRRSN